MHEQVLRITYPTQAELARIIYLLWQRKEFSTIAQGLVVDREQNIALLLLESDPAPLNQCVQWLGKFSSIAIEPVCVPHARSLRNRASLITQIIVHLGNILAIPATAQGLIAGFKLTAHLEQLEEAYTTINELDALAKKCL